VKSYPDLTIPQVGMVFFPVSLLWYGWSATKQAPWIVPEIATGLFGLGMFITFVRFYAEHVARWNLHSITFPSNLSKVGELSHLPSICNPDSLL